MRVLVTGSSGFVGSHVVEAFLAGGHKVRVLLRPGSPAPADRRVEAARGDYGDAAALAAAVKGCACVVHLGGVTKARTVDEYYAGNAESTRRLLEACVAAKPRPKRFLLVSSLAAAGPAAAVDRPVTEDDVPRPVEEYGRSKLAAELVARSFDHLVPVTIVRPPTVYGPRDHDCLAIFRQLERRVNLFYGNADKWMNVIHVDDLARGIVLAVGHRNAAHRTYFLADGRPLTWREFQGAVRTAVGKRALTVRLPAFVVPVAALFGQLAMRLTGKPALVNRQKARMAAPRFWTCDVTRARRELGFETKVTLAAGTRATLAWYRRERWL